jgi:hypothetical protein
MFFPTVFITGARSTERNEKLEREKQQTSSDDKCDAAAN